MKIGDTVKLKIWVPRQKVPMGREDHKTAKIVSVDPHKVVVDRDLNGMKHWNKQDLELVS